MQALSNNVHICPNRGLHSILLLPHYTALKAHLDTLEALPAPTFARQAHLHSHEESLDLLTPKDGPVSPTWDDWEPKVRVGYTKLVDTLWNTAKEFDVRGYGLVLREKLTTKWCDCGCSTDHLGEVCEKTVREEDEDSIVRSGKEREWDGRGMRALSFRSSAISDLL
jgi:RNA polymerase II-associated protein 3